jgi:alpha-mannosidase
MAIILALIKPRASFLSLDVPNVAFETAKKAEDGEGLIVRLYEAHGRTTRATLQSSDPIANVELVDLLEKHPQPLTVSQGRDALRFKPFEVNTLRVGISPAYQF